MTTKKIIYLSFSGLVVLNCNIGTIAETKKAKTPQRPLEIIKIFTLDKIKAPTKNLDRWIPPNPELRYDQVTFLTTHNCNSAYNYGYKPYAQQKWTIEEQLENGVRAILPDIFQTEQDSNKETKRKENESIKSLAQRATIRMSHGSSKFDKYLRPIKFLKSLTKRLQPKILMKSLGKRKKVENFLAPRFSDALITIKNFLKKNPNEVITILLESYVNNDLLDYVIEHIDGLPELVFKHSDWNFEKEDGFWPTIKWMQEKNKRLIIFNDKTIDETKYTLPTWKYVIENQFGKINEEARIERGESYDRRNYYTEEAEKKNLKSFPRRLILLNFFIKFPIPLENKTKLIKFLKNFVNNTKYTLLNTSKIEELINYIYKNGLDKRPDRDGKSFDTEPGKYPNFPAVDFVNKGNVMAIVNEINKKQADAAGLKTIVPQAKTGKPQKSLWDKFFDAVVGRFVLPGN